MGSLSQFRIDNDKSVEGVWHKFGGGIEVRIARMHNPEFNKYYEKISEPILGQLRRKTVDGETLRSLMKQAVAHCLIRDWKGMEDDDGKEIKYSPEKALEIISDPANVIFYDFVIDGSASINMFFEEQKKESEKNL